eukprot:8252691-Pyramimonas_sp.AAC.1
MAATGRANYRYHNDAQFLDQRTEQQGREDGCDSGSPAGTGTDAHASPADTGPPAEKSRGARSESGGAQAEGQTAAP